MAENVKTTEAITEKVSLDSLTVTGVNPIQEQQGLITKDQTYDVVKRNLGTIPHMALQQETDISIAEFLARPLLIATVTMGTPAAVTPWATFLTNPAVAAILSEVICICDSFLKQTHTRMVWHWSLPRSMANYVIRTRLIMEPW